MSAQDMLWHALINNEKVNLEKIQYIMSMDDSHKEDLDNEHLIPVLTPVTHVSVCDIRYFFITV